MGQKLTTYAIVLLLSLVSSTIGAGEAQVEGSGSIAVDATDAPAATTPIEVDGQYGAYGFLFEQHDAESGYGRFTAHEMAALGSAIVAFVDVVGGPGALSALVDGPVRVRQDLQSVVSYTQAGRVIGLGRGAFDLAVTEESNYYAWGAQSGDELAQIVFGHEVGHRWIEALRRQSGVDWGAAYGQNVWRGERASAPEKWPTAAGPGGDGVSPEEEAVTNLALFVLGRRYRWTFLHDAPASEARQVWIDGWVYDLVALQGSN